MEHEQKLTGGNVAAGVVRIGRTVRKPWTPATPSVHAYLTAVRREGVDVPRALGRDDRGRQIIEYVPGRLALDPDPLSLDGLARVGGLIRGIHDASATFQPGADARWDTAIATPGDELVCHNDLAPWNLIVGERWVFIDWDGAAPSTRLWDLAYAAQAFTLNDPAEVPRVAAAAESDGSPCVCDVRAPRVVASFWAGAVEPDVRVRARCTLARGQPIRGSASGDLGERRRRQTRGRRLSRRRPVMLSSAGVCSRE